MHKKETEYFDMSVEQLEKTLLDYIINKDYYLFLNIDTKDDIVFIMNEVKRKRITTHPSLYKGILKELDELIISDDFKELLSRCNTNEKVLEVYRVFKEKNKIDPFNEEDWFEAEGCLIEK